MSAATANEIRKGDVLEPCPDVACPGHLVFQVVTGPVLYAACDQFGCQEDVGLRRSDAERRLAQGGEDEDLKWFQK